jgi:hypothetical protein
MIPPEEAIGHKVPDLRVELNVIPSGIRQIEYKIGDKVW